MVRVALLPYDPEILRSAFIHIRSIAQSWKILQLVYHTTYFIVHLQNEA